MLRRRLRGFGPWIVVGHGLLFLALAAVQHATELAEVASLRGPAVAFALDGGLAVITILLGLWLRASPLPDDRQLAVAGWTFLGSLLFEAVVGVSILVKLGEGRAVAEPAFDMLLAGSAGAIAGFSVGYYNAKTHVQARQARRSSRAMAFVNGVIRHDLRNDLSAVVGTADLLEDAASEADPDEIRDQATLIQAKSEDALGLLEDTGVIARTVAGEADLQPVDLAQRVRDAAAKAPGFAAVEADVPDEAPVLANEGLGSVVDNLVENAIEHHDGDEPHVEVAVEERPDAVALRVADDGPGIPDEEKATLFEPREEGTHGGGLHLVSTLVDSFGGTIDADDREPRGTVFTVTLEPADHV